MLDALRYWSYVFGGSSGDLIYASEKFRDFELSLEWKISENGNSGILYLVADEDHSTPWQTGLEMQVVDLELTIQRSLCRWNLLGSGGVRYGRFELGSALVFDGFDDLDFFRGQIETAFEGYGATLSLEARRCL